MSKLSVIAAITSSRAVDAVNPDRNLTGAAVQSPQSVLFGTGFGSLGLPLEVLFSLDDLSSTFLPVTWDPTPYDPATADTYTLIGTPTAPLPTGITNTANVTASIDITVLADVLFEVYGAITGNDTTGDGSEALPYLTVAKCVTAAVALGGDRAIKLGVGTFTLTAFQAFPSNISIDGSGIDLTIIDGNAGLNYAADVTLSQWGTDKYLFQLTNGSPTNGNQTISNLTFDGSTRAKHGGVYINNKNNVTLRNVKFNEFNFAGLYFSNTDNLQLIDCTTVNCSISNATVSTGAVMFGHNTNTLINRLSVGEDRGFGVKAFGPTPTQPIIDNLRLINSGVSVASTRTYNTALANFALEMANCFLTNCEIDNCYFSNVVSLITAATQTSGYASGARTVHIHGNAFDQYTSSNIGPCIEASIHNIEVANNYFWGGSDGAIVSRNSADTGGAPKNNWYVYHNTFFDQQSFFNVAIIRSRYVPLTNFRFYNNTVHITTNTCVHIMQTENGQNNSNWTLRNNVILDESTADSPAGQGGPNQFVALTGGGAVVNLLATHNYMRGMPIGAIPGGTYNNNTTADPQLFQLGDKPDPYYRPLQTSPLLFAGIDVGLPFSGVAPTIGNYELSTIITNDIVDVATQDDRLISTGVAFVNLGLPANVQCTISDTSTPQIPVTWAPGAYNPLVEDIYTLIGTLVPPVGIDNPDLLTASITIIVVDAVFVKVDSFNRGSLGAGYTESGGNLVVTLDGSNMQFDGADGVSTETIQLDDSLVTINNLEAKTLQEVVELSSTSYGVGLGIQNLVNPDPNKGVLMSFHMSTAPESGRLTILSGNANTNPNDFVVRATATTELPVALGDIFEFTFKREIIGSDAVFTATVRNTVTDATNAVQWTEVGAGSMVFEATSKITIYHFGGLQQTNLLTVENQDIISPFPNVVSVQNTPAISVVNGTAFGSIGLPSTRTVTLSDATTPSYAIVWGIGSYSPTTAGTYNLIGTITLPVGVTNTSNVVATCAVTVQQVPSTQTFTYYVDGAYGGTSTGSITQPFKTIQAGVDVMVPGDTLGVRGAPYTAGIYRETVVPPTSGTAGNPITISRYPGETVVINGCELAGTSGWTVHSGQIYKKTITLPVNGYNNTTANNTTLLANQLFKDGVMMFEACWPKKTSLDDLLNRNVAYRNVVGFVPTSTTITDPGIPAGMNGARVIVTGWYVTMSATVTAHSGSTITYSPGQSDIKKRKYVYFTGLLSLLTNEKEWHYGSGILYFRQPGGGSPTGVEYKVRNYSFDLSGRSYININGIDSFGCEIKGNTSTNNCIVDNIRASYLNHAVLSPLLGGPIMETCYGNCHMTGMRLVGSNNIIRNSEFEYGSSQCAWLGTNGQFINNKVHDFAYDGNFGSIMPWGQTTFGTGGQKFMYNTIYRMGRGCIDGGYAIHGAHLNMEIAYNDMSEYAMLNLDTGALYTGHFMDLTGLRTHHNWVHDSHAIYDDGSCAAFYYDQASGPHTTDHNVMWNNEQCDIRTNPNYETRNPGPSNYFNNVFGTVSSMLSSHSLKISNQVNTAPVDIQRNNIYRQDVLVNFSAGVQDTANCLQQGTNPNFLGDGSVNGGLDFRTSGAPCLNAGAILPGYTDGYLGVAPDIGAYEQGDPSPYVPGYNAVAFEEPPVGDDPTPYRIEAESWATRNGTTNIAGGIGSCDAGDWTQYPTAFPSAKGSVDFRYSRGNAGDGTVEIRTGSSAGTLYATITLPTTGDWTVFATATAILSAPLSGSPDLFLVFPSGTANCNVDYVEFFNPVSATGILDSLTAVGNFTVPYDTDFGSNGIGLGLPQTTDCVFTDTSVGNVGLTWAIGTYSQSSPFYTDDTFTLIGTPVLVGGVTNPSLLTVSSDITVKDAFFPFVSNVMWLATTKGMATNTTNGFGIVDASNNISKVKSLAPGPTGIDLIVSGVAPKLSNGKAVFIGTGDFVEENVNSTFYPLSFNTTVKWTAFIAMNLTELGTYQGIAGNNGSFGANNGVAISYNGIAGVNKFTSAYITNSSGAALDVDMVGALITGQEHVMISQIDSSLAAAAGRAQAIRDTTEYNATAAGNGVFNNTPVAGKFHIGSFSNNIMTGTQSFWCFLDGTETDAVRNKFESDVETYLNFLPSSGYTTEYDTLLAQAVTDVVTAPSVPQQLLQDTLISDLKDADVWDDIDVMWIWGNNGGGEFGRYNWKDPTTYRATLVSSPTFTTDRGFRSADDIAHILLTWAPTNGVNFQQDDCCWMTSVITNADNSRRVFGADGTGNNVGRTAFQPRLTNAANWSLNCSDQNTANTSSPGIYFAQRTASNAMELFKNDVSLGTSTNASTTRSTRGLPAIAFKNNSDVIGSWFTSNIPFLLFGKSLSSTKRTALYNAINAYLTAIGAL